MEEIISELPLKDKDTEYILKTYNGWGDDPAKYIGIIKKASKGFFRLSKKEKLAFVRIASYYDSRYSIQINCFDPYIEEVAVQKLIELNENEFNCKGVHVWRHNYHIKGSKNDKSNLVTITEV